MLRSPDLRLVILMELNFDKEIDAILRKARDSETASAAESAQFAHLEADELTAFAENALPAAARQRYVAHLADCARCRKILSNLILINSEAEAPAAASPAVEEKPVETGIPWYRRFFSLPGLAYSLGALVLVFAGFLVFLVLENASGPNDMLRVATDAPAAREESSGAEPLLGPASSTNTNAVNANVTVGNTVATNTAAASNANTAFNTTNSSTANTTAAPPPPAATSAERTLTEQQEARIPSQVGGEVVTARTPPKVAADAAAETDVKEEAILNEQADAVSRQTAKQEAEERSAGSRRKSSPPSASPQAGLAEKRRSARDRQDIARVVGGKTFRYVGGTWFDAAYTQQQQIAVKRGSDQYRRLDADLRSIAEQLGGTVVVMWKGKAYRIE